MNKIIMILGITFFISLNIFSKEYADVKKEAEKKLIPLALKYEKELKDEKLNKAQTEYNLERYKIDTLMDLAIDIDASTVGMIDAMRDAYASYDKLLNKYYNLYRNTLNDDTKKALMEEQKAWFRVRDAYEEYTIRYVEHIETLMGGGTMWQLSIPSMNLEFLKNRVDELFRYYINE